MFYLDTPSGKLAYNDAKECISDIKSEFSPSDCEVAKGAAHWVDGRLRWNDPEAKRVHLWLKAHGAYKVVRKEEIVGRAMNMGEYREKKKVSWHVSQEGLAGLWDFRTKREAQAYADSQNAKRLALLESWE